LIEEIHEGTVVNWNDRGFGFIRRDTGGRDIFFHRAEIMSGRNELPIGTRVSFQPKPGKDERPIASNVRII
jgi:cold shock CspA family protein